MAGDWIAMRVDLADDPAVIQIAAMLGIDEYGVIGRLLKVWAWAGAQTTDGHVHVAKMSRTERDKCHADVTLMSRDCLATVSVESWIDRHVSSPGFAEAMVAAGWLVRHADSLVFPKFDRWNAQTAKQRLLATRRKAASRAEKVSKSVPKMSRSERDQNGTTEQDRTEQKEENPLTPLQGEVLQIPIELDTPEFRTLWAEWKAERRCRKVKPYTPTGEAQQLAALASFGVVQAMESIRESLRQGWQGLFKPKKTRANSDEKVMQQIMEGLQQP